MTVNKLIKYCDEQAEFYEPVTEGWSIFTSISDALKAGQQMRDWLPNMEDVHQRLTMPAGLRLGVEAWDAAVNLSSKGISNESQ